MTTEHTIEAALRERIAQLEADVLYIRGLAECANEDAEKADAQVERLRAQRDELVEVAKELLEFLEEGHWDLFKKSSELLKKY